MAASLPTQLADLDEQVGERYGVLPSHVATAVGVDPALFLAVIQTESAGRQFDASGNVLKSSAGALGLAQVRPIALADLQQRGVISSSADLSDPEINLYAGAQYLKQQLQATGGNVTEALRAYNAGLQGAQADPNAGADYADKVIALMQGQGGGGESPTFASGLVDAVTSKLAGFGVGALAWLFVGLLIVFGVWQLVQNGGSINIGASA